MKKTVKHKRNLLLSFSLTRHFSLSLLFSTLCSSTHIHVPYRNLGFSREEFLASRLILHHTSQIFSQTLGTIFLQTLSLSRTKIFLYDFPLTFSGSQIFSFDLLDFIFSCKTFQLFWVQDGPRLGQISYNLKHRFFLIFSLQSLLGCIICLNSKSTKLKSWA